ncbi:MAG: EamA family transporter [Candidatus Aenigmatarchaeota archaeon]|nr:MAG: EamA family transporter [Candidatus Aenigmarchaeota archaeon]
MKGTLYLILTGFFLGTIGIWVKLIGTSVSPFLLTIFRVLLAGALIFLLVLFTKDLRTIETLGIKKKNLLLFLVAGFFGVAIGFGFFMKSFSYVPVANVVLLVYIYPLVTALLSWIFLRERITRLEGVSLVLVLLGVWSIYGSELGLGANMLGNVLALLSGCGYAVFFVFIRFFERKGLPYWKVTFWPLVIGGLILIFFLPFEPLAFSFGDFIPLYILGIGFVSFLGYVLYAKGLKTIRVHNAAIIVTLTEPLTAIVLAFLILRESLPQHVMIGGVFIILANFLIGKQVRKKRIERTKETSEGFGWVW